MNLNYCPYCGDEFDYAWLYDAFQLHDYATNFEVECPACKRESIEITTHAVPEFEVIQNETTKAW